MSLLLQLVDAARAYLAAEADYTALLSGQPGHKKSRARMVLAKNAFLKELYATGYLFRVAQEIDGQAKAESGKAFMEEAQEQKTAKPVVDADGRTIQAGKWHEAAEVDVSDRPDVPPVQRCRRCGRTIAKGPAWFYPGDLVRVLSGTCRVERV